MNAVIGVQMQGASKSGALCATHAGQLNGQPGLSFFQIKRHARECDVCRELRKGTK